MTAGGRGAVAAVLAAVLASGCVTQPAATSTSHDRNVSPQSLVGLSPAQIVGTLGDPELRRSEPPAEVWQYRTQTCVVDLYLYEELGGLRVLTYQVRPRATAPVRAESCLSDVVAQAGVRAAS